MKRILGCVMLLALAGCAVGPDFKAPTWNLGSGWLNGGSQAAKALPVEWWTAMGDPVLNDLVTTALKNGSSARIAQARVVQARALRLEALSTLFPEVDANASGDYGKASMNAGKPISGKRETRLFTAGFDAAWELDIFGGNRRGAEASYAEWMAAREDEADARLSLAADVVSTYMDYRLAEERTRLAEQNVKAQERTVQLTEARNRVGDVSGLDVQQAKAQMLATRALLPQLAQEREVARGSLAVLVDQPATTFTVSDSIPLTEINLPEMPAGLPSTLLERRPDVIAAEKRWHAATARIGQAEAARFPDFSLTAALGSQSTQLSSLVKGGSGFWTLTPQASLPLLDFGARRAAVKEREGEETEAMATYRQAVLVALKDVESALVGVSQERVRLDDLSDAAEASEKAYGYADKRYRAGEEGLLTVLTAQGTVTSAEDARAASQVQMVKNWVALVKAVGGGYPTPVVSATVPVPEVSGTMPVSASFTTANK